MDWTATAIDVPGDGKCLFHAIALQLGLKGNDLKSLVIAMVEDSPDIIMHEQTLRQWIAWDLKISSQEYANNLRMGMWGGAIETTLLASLLNIIILVYERKGNFCRQIADSRPDKKFPKVKLKQFYSKKYLCLLWTGDHYMILDARQDE
jgi:hypothetical protein